MFLGQMFLNVYAESSYIEILAYDYSQRGHMSMMSCHLKKKTIREKTRKRKEKGLLDFLLVTSGYYWSRFF